MGHWLAYGSLEALPTEVISEAIAMGTIVVPPDPDEVDGQWIAEVGVNGRYGPIGVGTLDEILEAAKTWQRDVALRWQEKRRGDYS